MNLSPIAYIALTCLCSMLLSILIWPFYEKVTYGLGVEPHYYRRMVPWIFGVLLGSAGVLFYCWRMYN